MSETTRIVLALVALLVLVVGWLGGTVATVVYACQPGNAGAVVLAGLVFCLGYGFVQEARQRLGESL